MVGLVVVRRLVKALKVERLEQRAEAPAIAR